MYCRLLHVRIFALGLGGIDGVGSGRAVAFKQTIQHSPITLIQSNDPPCENVSAGIQARSRQFADVAACSAVLRGTVSARAGFDNATVDLFGIDATSHLQTTNLAQQPTAGSLDEFRNNPNAIIIGSRLAEFLQVEPGDALQLLSPGGEYRRFAIARNGVGVVDAVRVYCHVRVAQTLLRKPFAASMIVYKLRDPERAPTVARAFENLFQHEAQSWQDREEANLQLFMTVRLSAAITVSLIILLAGFGIFNVLTMSVLSKIKEIAILRSMGYRARDISAIFLWQGAMIATAGSVIGCIAGAAFTWGVSKIPHPGPGHLVRKPFSGDVELAPLPVGHAPGGHRRLHRQLRPRSARGAACAGRHSSWF
jgi:lipoprotein-releasing system permease protein